MEELGYYNRYRSETRALDAPRIFVAPPEGAARLLRGLARDRRVALVADTNTAAAAPEIVDALEDSAELIVLPGSPRLIPEIERADAIAARAKETTCSAIVVIGGGTLTDLAKYAAWVAQVDLVSVPSAASVDAYNSARSALRIDGYHHTPDARVPSVIVASPAIVESAPDVLTFAGLGDLIAKLLARLDWNLSAIVTGERFSLREAEWSARVARHALARLRHAGLEHAAMPALDALLVTGRSMRVFGSSRPAASSEHTMAHLWEVALDDHDSYHGLLVTRAAQVVVRAYRWITRRLADGGAFMAWDPAAEARWEERAPAEMAPFLGKMREESAGRNVTPQSVSERRAKIDASRAEIVALAERALSDAERGLAALDIAGIEAWLPKIDDAWVDRSVRWVKYLRNRYSLFDLAFEAGWEEDLLSALGAEI